MSIEITEEEISAEIEVIHKDYPVAVKNLPQSSIREGAIHRLFWRKRNVLDKSHLDAIRDHENELRKDVDTSAESA